MASDQVVIFLLRLWRPYRTQVVKRLRQGTHIARFFSPSKRSPLVLLRAYISTP